MSKEPLREVVADKGYHSNASLIDLEEQGVRGLRGRGNILKRLLIQVSGFNLGLVMRKLCGIGTPRGLQGLRAALSDAFASLSAALRRLFSSLHSDLRLAAPRRAVFHAPWPSQAA